MSLLHPTLGEMFDRAVVLTVKIGRCIDGSIVDSRFRKELDELSAEINRANPDYRFTNVDVELVAIHNEMFDLIAKAESGIEVSGIRLQQLNRRRVEIRESIDKAVGQFEGSERI